MAPSLELEQETGYKIQQNVTPAQRSGLPTETSTSSYWHSEPNKFLQSHRSTPALPRDADVCIIGSGLTGSSVAQYLLNEFKFGGTLVMLEAREACWGASGRNGGHCQPRLLTRETDVSSFELKNYEEMKHYVHKNNIPCDWRDGLTCRVYWTETAFSAGLTELEIVKRVKPEIAEHVQVITDRGEIAKHNVPEAYGIILSFKSASVWPYKLVAWTLENLIKTAGLNLQTKTAVQELKQAGGSWDVCTERGTLRAHHVVLATNAYISHLLPEFEGLIVPVRGQVSAFLEPAGQSLTEDTYSLFGTHGEGRPQHDYLVQRWLKSSTGEKKPGLVIFGGGRQMATHGSVGVSDDSETDVGTTHYLRNAVPSMYTFNGDDSGSHPPLKPTHEWSGIMGGSRDDKPWIGEVPGRSNLWSAAGYSGHGMPTAVLSGKAVARMISGAYEGAALTETISALVEVNELPQGYIVTEERMKRARTLPQVS